MAIRIARSLAVGCVLVSTMITAGPAGAAPTCHGSGCNGRNPITSGCASDGTTIAAVSWSDHAAGSFSKHTVYLRYSPRCNASWSKVTTASAGTVHVTGVEAWMLGHYASTKRHRSGAGTTYSLMFKGRGTPAVGRSNFNDGAVVKKTIASPPP